MILPLFSAAAAARLFRSGSHLWLCGSLLLAPVVQAAPAISSASLTPQPVNITTGAKFVTITVSAADATAVEEITATFHSPSGFPLAPVTLGVFDRISGTDMSGQWQTVITAPAYAPPEAQTISWAVRNTSGQTTTYSAGVAPLPGGVQGILTLQNTGPVDTTGPSLTSISTNPAMVDITNGAATLELSATFQDNISGLASAFVSLYPPTGNNNLLFETLYFGFPPYPTTPFATGATLTIPRYIAPGNYRWVVTGKDAADRLSEFGSASGRPFPGAFSGTLQVLNSGPVDLAAPALVSLSVNPGTRAVSSLPSNITFTAQVSDDVGVELAEGLLATPDGLGYTSFPLTRTGGTAANGTWAGSVSLTSDYPAGSHLTGIQLTDVTGKSSVFGIYNFFSPLPAGSAQSVLVTNGTPNAYTTWRYARPALTGATGVPGADYDEDGLPNAVEFLCGTDPLLGTADPNASRAPVYSLTASHLRVEYRLSAVNAALGSGNALILQPQSSPTLGNPWSAVTPVIVSGDLRRAEIPLTGGTRQFLRFAVLP